MRRAQRSQLAVFQEASAAQEGKERGVLCLMKTDDVQSFELVYSSGTSISPLSMAAMISEGCWPFTVQPTELAMKNTPNTH